MFLWRVIFTAHAAGTSSVQKAQCAPPRPISEALPAPRIPKQHSKQPQSVARFVYFCLPRRFGGRNADLGPPRTAPMEVNVTVAARVSLPTNSIAFTCSNRAFRSAGAAAAEWRPAARRPHQHHHRALPRRDHRQQCQVVPVRLRGAHGTDAAPNVPADCRAAHSIRPRRWEFSSRPRGLGLDFN